MASEDYVFDPDGDLVLILTKQREVPEELLNFQEALGNVAVPAEVIEPLDDYGDSLVEHSLDTDITVEMLVNPLSEEHLTKENSEPADVDTRFPMEPEDIYMQVSSKHLILASSFFAKMLRGKFREAETLRSAGHAEMRLPDDDPVAFSILLNIAHGHTRRVPRRIELTTLTEIASLVDKYYMHEVVEMYSDMWIELLKMNVPHSFTNDLLPWICISWIFQKPDIFKNTTRIAQRESKRVVGEGRANALPIPNRIIESIENSRQHAISGIISSLEDLKATYQDHTPLCKRVDARGFHCDAMVLGSLHKESFRLGLLPAPNLPYQGFSYDSLAQDVKTMNIKTLCELYEPRHNSYSYTQTSRTCMIWPTTKASVESLQDQLGGLDLAEFKARSKRSRSKKIKSRKVPSI